MKIHCIKVKLMFRGRNFSLPRVKRHWLLFTYTATVVFFCVQSHDLSCVPTEVATVHAQGCVCV